MATVTKKTIALAYTLTLNQEEASTLVAILKLIGGNASCTPRRYADAIRAALENEEVEPISYRTRSNRDEIFFE